MLRNYLKVIQRKILKQPLHAALNLSCLTIGIVGALLILLYLDFELTYDSHHAHSDRIYRVATSSIKTHEKTIDVAWNSTPAPLGPTIKQDYSGIETYTRLYQFWSSENVKFQYNANVQEEAEVYTADPTVFDVFTFDFIKGDAANALDGPNKIVISESLAKQLFGEEIPLGKILNSTLVHGLPGFGSQYSLIITGVYRDMPKNVHLYAQALISSQTDPALTEYYFNTFNVYTYLLLYPQTDSKSIASRLSEVYTKYLDPARDPVLVSASHTLVPITKIHIEATGGLTYIYIFSAIGLLLLLISGISYVNLTTAQASSRALEIGLRKVLGSQRKQLVFHFLAESLFLTMVAMILAIGLVILGMTSVNAMLNLNLDIKQLWQPQLVLGIVFIILLLGILGGSYPAFFLASFEPLKVMKDKAVKNAPLRKILVSIQLAAVIFVLISTGVIYDQLQYLRKKDMGFDKKYIVNLTIPSQDENASKYMVLKNTLLQNANILAVGTSDFTPGADDMRRRPIAVDGSAGQEQKFVYSGRFDYNFLSAMNIRILSGRNFSANFPGDTSAIIVNEALVRAFALKEPLGDKVRFGGKGNPKFFVIVGVVNDFHQSSLYNLIEPQMYVLKTSNKLFIKIANDIPSSLKHIEESWAKVFPDSPFSYRFIEDQLQDGYKGDQIRGKVFFLLALFTIFIAFLGLFGLASYLATQRIKEIGIRKILGATLKDTVFLITGNFIFLVLMSAIPAFILSWYIVNRWLENFAFRTDINYNVFGLSLLFTLLLTFVATGIHAWRAAIANPVKNLRYD